MASLPRPSKRQKKDAASREVFKQPKVFNINSCIDSSSLMSLVEEFANAHFNHKADIIEVIGKIRSNRNFVLECNDPRQNATLNFDDHNSLFLKLHRALILHLGFLLGSYKKSRTLNEKWEGLLCSLIFCLRDLYINNDGKLLKYIVQEEFNELFILVPKVLRTASLNIMGEVNVFESNERQKIIVACYQIIKSSLNAPIRLQNFFSEITTTTSENFLIGLLKAKHPNINVDANVQDNGLEILERLQSLLDQNLEFRKLLDVTLLVMKSYPSLSCGHLSPQLNLFYWRCVCCLFGGKTEAWRNTEIEIADHAVDSILSHSTSSKRLLSRQAIACVGEFIQTSSHDKHVRLIDIATSIILKTNPCRDERAIEDGSLIETIKCFGFCIKKASTTDYFLQMKGWEKVFDNLVRLAIDEKYINVAETAAIALIPLLKALVSAAEHHSSLPFRKSIQIFLKLISLQNVLVVGVTLESLFNILQNSEIRSYIKSSTLSNDFVYELALLASKNFIVEECKKAKLAQMFSILIDDIRNVHFLARKSSNLAFLVRLANGSYCETDQSRVQQISIYMVIKLARNPCNQRILAKEPGLLSSLIRYTRTTPEDDKVFHERSVSRKELKDRILVLASAL